MALLFDRSVKCNIGGLVIESPMEGEESSAALRVSFKIPRSLRRDPNTSTLSIYNLSKDSRAQLQEKDLETTIEAGYVDAISQIFGGEMQLATSINDGVDWVTTIQSDDGGKQYQTARINESIKGPAKVGDVLKKVAEAMGLGEGNFLDKAGKGSVRGSLSEWTSGMVLSGRAEQQLDKIVRSMGYSWSIQDGQLQLLELEETIGDQVNTLRPGTGLIGSPEAGENGIVKARSLIQPDLQPGKKVEIVSSEVDGFFRIEKTVYTGDTRGSDWYADIEAKPL